MGVVITGGTDNHLMLVDVRPLGVTGKEADAALGEVNITVNRNTIPYDPNPPWSPAASGLERQRSPGAAWARRRCARSGRPDRGWRRGEGRCDCPGACDRERVAAVADRFPVPGMPGTRERLVAAVAAGR